MLIPSHCDINNFSVRIDVNVATKEGITEFGSVWYGTQQHTVDEVFDLLVHDVAGEMGEY